MIDIDFFSPARKDWIEGKDNYFEKKQVYLSFLNAKTDTIAPTTAQSPKT